MKIASAIGLFAIKKSNKVEKGYKYKKQIPIVKKTRLGKLIS
jgi:hypothetical protein